MTGSPQESTVFVVDDDRMARESVCALVRSLGVRAESFPSAEDFLADYTPGRPGCLVTDVRMLGMSGVELQQKLKEDGVTLPVIVLTAYPRTPLTVKVMQQGAVTLLEKPYEEDDLWDAIRQALAVDARTRLERDWVQEVRRRLDSLTDKEREVLDGIVAGKSNKAIARELDVSIRTVENRRRDIFTKLQAESVAELVRLVIQADLPD
jgi:FixJ family two-component response regulator